MRTILTPVDVLQNCKDVRLILVQFQSPFGPREAELEFQSDIKGKRFEWKNKAAVDARSARFRAILSALEADDLFSSKPIVIAFPEYSVPKECHAELQSFSDKHNAIVVPGTYFADDGDLKKSNVCKIYLPGQEPVTIVKKNGFQGEADALRARDDLPNIAHLLGHNNVLGPFSISVFICRDYLIPYRVTEADIALLTDWNRPGINLVSMCTTQTSLFEGLAAFDARELRGRRRIVALCNCAGTGIEGATVAGSALLGPRNPSVLHEGDIIESLRGKDEGVIIADISLDHADLAVTIVKPGTEYFSPVKHAVSYKIIPSVTREDGAPAIELERVKGSRATERGVFHPAFLEAIKRNITLELFRTRQLERARRAFSGRAISSVSAFVVEGMHDLVVRYYQAAADPNLALRSTPYNQLSKEKFDSLFVSEHHVVVRIEPKDILKYRTIKLERNAVQEPGWQERRQQIEHLIPLHADLVRRHNMLQKIVLLSENWNDPSVSLKERTELAPVFLDKRESVTPIAEYQTGRMSGRRKYVLVSEPGANDASRVSFELEIIYGFLINLPEVRSIYRIKTDIDKAYFDYWLDLFGEPWRLAEIVQGISRLANNLGIDVGTRTMEVQEQLIAESVQGLFASDLNKEVSAFLEETRTLDQNIQIAVSVDDWRRASAFADICGKAWYSQVDHWFSSWSPAELRSFRAIIDSIYGYFFWGNLSDDLGKKEDYLKKARNAWMDLYQRVERQYKRVLFRHLGVETEGEMWPRALQVLKDCGVPERELERMPKSTFETVMHLMRVDKTLPPPESVDMKAIARNYKDRIAPLRNRMTHDDDAVVVLSILMKTGENRLSEAERISSITHELIGLLDIAESCLRTVGGHVS